MFYGPGWKTFIPIQVAGHLPADVDGMDGRIDELVEAIVRQADGSATA